MMVSLFQFPAILDGKLCAVSVQDDDGRYSVGNGMAVFCIHRLVMFLVHVNQNNYKIGLEPGRDFRVGLAECMQFVAPGAPIGAELQQNPFSVLVSQGYRVRNL